MSAIRSRPPSGFGLSICTVGTTTWTADMAGMGAGAGTGEGECDDGEPDPKPGV